MTSSSDSHESTPSPAVTIRVGDFEGPLDLLLHLCRTNEIDLSRLPVRTVTDQYLTHLEAIEFRDLESAGAFLVMAATLVYLKSKLLLPAGESAEEALDEEGETLRLELQARVAEYARVKTAGAWLAEREARQALLFGRPGNELPAADEIPLEDLSVQLLTRAMTRLIEERRRRAPPAIAPEPPSVLERMAEILSLLRSTWSVLFSAVTGGDRRHAELVVTLLALLELERLGRARARQTELFGEIVIERREGEVEANA
jgi:segregation and condensation protein A